MQKLLDRDAFTAPVEAVLLTSSNCSSDWALSSPGYTELFTNKYTAPYQVLFYFIQPMHN
jgi:hypothetical protein